MQITIEWEKLQGVYVETFEAVHLQIFADRIRMALMPESFARGGTMEAKIRDIEKIYIDGRADTVVADWINKQARHEHPEY